MHAFDRRTDRHTDSFLVARPRCVQCSEIIIQFHFTNVSMVTIWFPAS